MLRVISIFDEINNEQIETINNIKFEHDIIVCCKTNPVTPIIEYSNGDFFIKNIVPISIHQNEFNITPNIKLSFPQFLKVNFESAIRGMEITNISDTIKAVTYNDKYPICFNNKIMNFHFKEHNRKVLTTNNFKGLTINEKTNIIKFDFIFKVIAEGISEIKNIYIIHHNKSFDTFPDL
jgi:hypothetical protein